MMSNLVAACKQVVFKYVKVYGLFCHALFLFKCWDVQDDKEVYKGVQSHKRLKSPALESKLIKIPIFAKKYLNREIFFNCFT